MKFLAALPFLTLLFNTTPALADCISTLWCWLELVPHSEIQQYVWENHCNQGCLNENECRHLPPFSGGIWGLRLNQLAIPDKSKCTIYHDQACNGLKREVLQTETNINVIGDPEDGLWTEFKSFECQWN
jgi:hypothetical protein